MSGDGPPPGANGGGSPADDPPRLDGVVGDGDAGVDPDDLPPVTDVHVHLMPDRLMAAIREALGAAAGWTFPHPTDRAGVEATLRAAGVERYVALPYAHEPGMAADLNEWVLDRAAGSAMAVPFATVHPGDGVGRVVGDAFDAGARGLKFQCPVQEAAPDDPRLDPAFELAAEHDRPVLFHAGTAPMFADSPYVGADRFEAFLESYPDVRGCCAHMGTDDWAAFADLARTHDNAYLDTAYVFGEGARRDIGPSVAEIPTALYEELSDSVLYGSDYPNVTYDYGEAVEGLLARDLSADARLDLTRRTPAAFLGEP